ncbi:AraC family transcriptional regulator [Agromyces albus]|uniref:AraC family transcriptional regulator n=1 Tax=Agromyces albus TaxID=205332 RepID=A0A4Q2L5N4_9MICO|nr:AraC family transcriptional regulator [Agromyces albus]RXZ71702.1 AraC family transcriptional regulator [Agromyces albus]
MSDVVRAWGPDVPGIREVLHATFETHAYPAHTHDEWTVLLVDEGVVEYTLHREAHRTSPSTVSILPPHVSHDGSSALPGRPFRKRVLYLDAGWLPVAAASAAVARPILDDREIVRAVRALHRAVVHPAEDFAAEVLLHELRDRILDQGGERRPTPADRPLARRLRDLLDERLTESYTIEEAARVLGAHPSHLVRAFSRAYGIAPHRYVIGRRLQLARRLLLVGEPPSTAAVVAGFHDQAHLTRHFRRVLGVTPAAFARAS